MENNRNIIQAKQRKVNLNQTDSFDDFYFSSDLGEQITIKRANNYNLEDNWTKKISNHADVFQIIIQPFINCIPFTETNYDEDAEQIEIQSNNSTNYSQNYDEFKNIQSGEIDYLADYNCYDNQKTQKLKSKNKVTKKITKMIKF